MTNREKLQRTGCCGVAVLLKIHLRIDRIFKTNFAIAYRDNSTNFADNSRSCRRILVKYFSGIECLTSNKPFDLYADPDHDPDPGFFWRIFYCLGGDLWSASAFSCLLHQISIKFCWRSAIWPACKTSDQSKPMEECNITVEPAELQA